MFLKSIIKLLSNLLPLLLLIMGLACQNYIQIPIPLIQFVVCFSVIVIVFKALTTHSFKGFYKLCNLGFFGYSLIPFLIEATLYLLTAYCVLSMSLLEAATLALAAPALSPALVYPALDSLEQNSGKSLLNFKAMAALENVCVILLFSIWMVHLDNQQNWDQAIFSILSAFCLGASFAFLLAKLKHSLSSNFKLLMMISLLLLFTTTIGMLKLSIFISALAFAISYAKIANIESDIQNSIHIIWKYTGPLFYFVLGLWLPLSFIFPMNLSILILILLGLFLRFLAIYLNAPNKLNISNPMKRILSAIFLPKLTLQLVFASQILKLNLMHKAEILSIISMAVLVSCLLGLGLQSYFYLKYSKLGP